MIARDKIILIIQSILTLGIIECLLFSFHTLDFQSIPSLCFNLLSQNLMCNVLLLHGITLIIIYFILNIISSPYIHKRKQNNLQVPYNLNKRYHRNIKNIPPPYPNGWFYICHSQDLKSGELKYISILGKEFVLFREENSIPKMNYTNSTTGTSNIQEIIISEKNGMIFMWYHLEHSTPFWEIPNIDAFDSNNYQYVGYSKHEVYTHIQDIPENGADIGHLNYLHSPLFSFFKKLGFSYRFSSKWEVMRKKKHISQIKIIQALYFMNYSIPFTKQYAFVNQYGPGIVVLEFKLSIGKASAIQTVTPIEPMYQILVHTMYMPWYIPKILCKIAFRILIDQIERDIPIWNNKIYLVSISLFLSLKILIFIFKNKPILCKGDGNIAEFRRWYKQFYINVK